MTPIEPRDESRRQLPFDPAPEINWDMMAGPEVVPDAAREITADMLADPAVRLEATREITVDMLAVSTESPIDPDSALGQVIRGITEDAAPIISAEMVVRPAYRPAAKVNKGHRKGRAPSAVRADGKVDFEHGMSPFPPLTIVLMLVNIAIFMAELGNGALESPESIVAFGAISRETVWGQGEFWRLFSMMFLHGNIEHLVGNMIMLFLVGMALEHAIGTPMTLVVYLGAGFVASMASSLLSPGPSVGASGAIFGLWLAVVVFLERYRHRFHLRDNAIKVFLAILAGWNIVQGFSSPMIDNWAHVGGALGGALLAWVVTPRSRRMAREITSKD